MILCQRSITNFTKIFQNVGLLVGSYHHGMARSLVADRGTASDMDGNCE